MVRNFETILFPGGANTANQRNDVDIVFNSVKYCVKLITNDGGSKRQSRGILGNRPALFKIGATVLTPDEAQTEVVEAIKKRDIYAKKWA